MNDKNDFMRVPASSTLRIASRQDNRQNQTDLQDKEKKKKPESELISENEIEDLDTNEIVKFGNIVFKKRNTELKLFIHLRKSPELRTRQYKIYSHSIKNNEKKEINILQAKIAEYEKDLLEIKLKPSKKQDIETNMDIDETIENLTKLLILYNSYFKCVQREIIVLKSDIIEDFEDIINEKDDILDQIDFTLLNTNFEPYKNNLPDNENKIKATKILSDIHNVINEIMKQEDENRVELQNIKDGLKLEIAKQERGAKAISKYGQANVKSHFIDKKT